MDAKDGEQANKKSPFPLNQLLLSILATLLACYR